MFDQADQVEVIDIEPEDLIERMKEGKIYGPVQAERALENFSEEKSWWHCEKLHFEEVRTG